MTFVNEKTEDGKWRTVDRERNVILSKVSGPDAEGQYDCELIFNELPIRFVAVSGMKIHGKPKLGEKTQYEMNWHIFRLFIPENLQDHKSEITGLIKEALEVWGWNYRTDNAHSVSVQFSPNLM